MTGISSGKGSMPEQIMAFFDRKLPKWKTILLAFLALWGIIFYFRCFNQKLLLGDEGVALMNGWRIALGEIPHRDFFEFIPPASFLPTAALFKLFGPSILISRILAFFLSALLIFSLDFLLRQMEADFSLRILSVSLLIPFGVPYWPIPSHHWWADIFCLLSASFFLKASAGNSVKLSAFLAGVFMGLAVCSLQDQGGYFLILIAVLFLPFLPGISRKNIVLFSFCGFAAASLPFVLWLLPTAGFNILYNDLIIFPLNSYHNLEAHKAHFFSGWSQFFPLLTASNLLKAPVYLVSMAVMAFFFMLLPVISLAGILISRVRKSFSSLKLALAAAVFLSFLATALHRWSFTNVVWALPGLVVPLTFFYAPKTKYFARTAALSLSLAAIMFSASFYGLADPSHMVSVSGEGGSLKVFHSGESVDLAQLVDYLESHKGKNDTLFCGGFSGLVNVLTLMKNPTPFNDFVDYNTEEQLHALSGSLKSGRGNWVCLQKNHGQMEQRLGTLICDDYRLCLENGHFRLYRLDRP
jgi:hypothetical protein